MDRIADVMAVIGTELPSHHVPGLAFALINGGQVVGVAGSGERIAGGDPVSADTAFEAASLTKPVVARLAIGLHLAGRLDLDVPLTVGRLLADAGLDPRFDRLTARHILSHRSGLPNWRRPGEPLSFLSEPGSRERYSGEAFNLLLETIIWILQAGLPGGDELDKRARTYGLNNAYFEWQQELERCCAWPHDTNGDPMTKNRPARATGAGSLHCSVRDYAGFIASWIDASQHDADGSFAWRSVDRRRALGWAVASEGHGEILWQHGDNPGYKHLAAFNPGTGDAVVVMTNGDCGRELAVRVVAQILGPSRIWTSATDREATT